MKKLYFSPEVKIRYYNISSVPIMSGTVANYSSEALEQVAQADINQTYKVNN